MTESPETRATIREVRDELDKWRLLRAQLENTEEIDERCLIDTLEGETNLTEAILEIENEIAEREALSEAIGVRIKDMQARKQRVDGTAETLRNIILQSMDMAGLPKVSGPGATISVRMLPPEIIIENESLIPATYWVPQDPKLDKKALGAAVAGGENVPGTSRSNGRISLTIRRK